MKKVIAAVVLSFIAISWFGFVQYQKWQARLTINSYATCSAAGYPLSNGSLTCTTPDGRSFTSDTGNQNAYQNEILVDSPHPNQTVASHLLVNGRAHGSWFSEGTFSGELFDGNNQSLGTVQLVAKGDWMSDNFVPFSGELNFTTPDTKSGTLVLHNANPSGITDNDKTLLIPVQFP